jgi:hypothetical protein
MATVSGFRTIDAASLSGAGATVGRAMNLRNMSSVAFQAEWTGTLAGALTWESSNAPPGQLGSDQPAAGATWTVLTAPSTFAAGDAAGSAGSFLYRFTGLGELWIRPRFTWASGTGVLTITANGKE